VAAHFLVVDDHPLFLEALKHVLHGAYPDEATSITSTHTAFESQQKFDLVLLDLSLPGTNGLDGLLELRTRYPKQPIVIVSALEDPRIVHEVMTCGAAGYISKSTRSAELRIAIRDVLAGNLVLPNGYQPVQTNALPTSTSVLTQRLATLTPQQVRVLQMLRQGLLNKQIAYELSVGETTVKAHVSEILRKLRVSSRTQAVIEVAKTDFEVIVANSKDRGQEQA